MSKTIRAYYNEFDPKAASWLRQLIKNGNITQGEVDERSITEVKQSDLQGFDRVHFFSGIGTWDYCLNQAGWGDRPVWTASLPCQPFSTAGKGLGKDDERHLLPHFLELVRQCKPDTIFGEQVERAIVHGWLDDLQAAMEAENYAIGHCVLGAHSIGAPHIRQRLYWVADSKTAARKRTKQGNHSKSYGGEFINGMGDTEHEQYKRRLSGHEEELIKNAKRKASEFTGSGEIEWICCRDNKYRPIEPSIQPLVDGLAKGMVHSSDTGAQINANATQEARIMRLKGYGNAIQAQTAIAFINAFLDLIGD